MRKEKIAFGLTVTLTLLFAASSWGADIAKIGVVDFQKVLSVSNAGKHAQAEINKQGKSMEEDLKKKGVEIEEIKKRLERETLVMSKDKRDEKEREFRIKLNDFKVLKKKYATNFKRMEKRLVNRIQKAIFKLVEEMGLIAEVHGVTTGQVALNWLITFSGDTVITIPGASKVKHSTESAAKRSVE